MIVTAVEALIAVCVASGEWTDLRDLAEAERVVSGGFLRRVLTGMPLTRSEHAAIAEQQPDYAPFHPAGDFAPVPVAAPGVRLRGVVITGVLDLSNCASPGGAPLPALALEQCRLLGTSDVREGHLQNDSALMCLDLSRASIANLSLKDSAFTHVAMVDARIDGPLEISGVKPLAGWIDRDFESGRMTAFRSAMLAGRGDLKASPYETQTLPGTTMADRARAEAPGAMHPHHYCWLDLSGTHIRGSVLVQKARLRAPRRDSEGRMDIVLPPRFALRLERAVVAGALDARGSVFDGGLSLYLADIRDDLWLGRGSCLLKEQGNALDAQGARLGSIYAIAAPPLRILGTAFLNSVRLSGHLKVMAADIDGDGSPSLVMETATIDGDMSLETDTSTGAGVALHGPVKLGGTRVGGSLDLRGALLSGNAITERDATGQATSTCGNAIDGQNLSVGRDAFLSDGFIAHGCVWLNGARIGDDLDLRGATLAGTSALSGSDMAVGGSVRMGSNRPSARKFVAQGLVSLQRASIGKDLDVINARISSPPDAQALDLGWVAVAGTLIFSANRFDGTVSLEHASTNILCDNEDGYSGASNLNLNGLRYDAFYEPQDDDERSPAPDLVENRKAWLKRMRHYRPQPYANLAKVLMRDGRPDEARDILVEKYRRERGERGSLFYVASTLWGLMFGYGLKPSRAMVTLLCAFLVGWAFFAFANSKGKQAMVIDQVPIAGYVQGDKMGALRTADATATGVWCHNSIDPALYALDVFIPLVDLRQEAKCEMDWAIDAPAKNNSVANSTADLEIELYRYAKTVYALSGWMLISLAILTFSGVLERRNAEE